MIKTFVSSLPMPNTVSLSDNGHNVVKADHNKEEEEEEQQNAVTTNSAEEQQQRATRIVLRLTPYGMTDLVHCHCQNCPFVQWSGHPIMRFVHPDHVQRLCAGLCEASKTEVAISIPDIPCCIIDPCILLSTTTTTLQQEPCYDTLIQLTVHEAHSVYICVLYYYPRQDNHVVLSRPISDNDDSNTTTTTTSSNSNNQQQQQQQQQPVHSRLAHEAVVASLVLLQIVLRYSYYLVPVKLLLHNVFVMFLQTKKNR